MNAPSTPPIAASGEPLARLHRLLLSLFGSSEHFRRWVVLGPRGHELVAELPERPASTAAALLDGIDVLARRGHVSLGFFARLVDEFPLRADDIRGVAAAWADRAWTDRGLRSDGCTGRVGRRSHQLLLALGLLLASTWATELPCAEVLLVRPDDAAMVPRIEPVVIPDRKDVAARPIGPRRPKRSHPATKKIDPGVARAPASVCVLSPSFAEDLGVLAHETLASAAIVERFTIVLRAGASSAEVSPRPLPGQAPRRRMYERLIRIGPVALDECHDTPVDIAFSTRRTTVTPRPR